MIGKDDFQPMGMRVIHKWPTNALGNPNPDTPLFKEYIRRKDNKRVARRTAKQVELYELEKAKRAVNSDEMVAKARERLMKDTEFREGDYDEL